MASITIVYTTTDKLRACIGCDGEDLPDAVINSRDLDLLMLERLDTVFPAHASNISAPITRKLTLWCLYFGALTLIEDAVLALPQKIQSNTDQIQRFNIDFEALKSDLRNKLGVLETALNPALSSAATAYSIMGKASPSYDVITGQ
jgi:hypothetical protein